MRGGRGIEVAATLARQEGLEALGAYASAGEYEIVRKLGGGAMGDVYEARHPVLGTRVAVKVVKQVLASSQESAQRFVREAKAVNQIDHVNVIKIFGFGRLVDGRLYLVMELLEGDSFDRILERDGPLTIPEFEKTMKAVCSAVEAAHQAGVIHRDLKPSNLFRAERADGSSHIYVLDFGIAKLMSSAQDETGQTLTGKGVWIGTPAYMAPEEWTAEGASVRTDIYALGVTGYELLTGECPFTADSIPGIMQKHFLGEVPRIAGTARGIPHRFEDALRSAMAKDPESRFASAEDLWLAICGQQASPQSQRRDSAPWVCDAIGSVLTSAVHEGLAALLRRVSSRAGELSAQTEVSDFLRTVAQLEQSDACVEIFDTYREVFRALGLSQQALAILDQWLLRKSEHSHRLDLVTVAYAIDTHTESGRLRLRRRGDLDRRFDMLRVVAEARSRNLKGSIELAQAYDWMLGRPQHRQSMAHAVTAMIARHEFDAAERVIHNWRATKQRGEPATSSLLLRLEAKVASYQDKFHLAASLLERAVELAVGGQEALDASYAQAEYVAALARIGATEEAGAIAQQWPSQESQGYLAALRALAKTELALAGGQREQAFLHAQRAHEYFDTVDDALGRAEASFYRLLCSERLTCGPALDAFHEAVSCLPVARYTQRVAIIDQLCVGSCCLEDVQLVERTRYAQAELPLFRAWVPRGAALGATLFWNRVRGTLYVQGTGPYDLGKSPVLRKVLEAVLASTNFSVSITALAPMVWGEAYRAQLHDRRIRSCLRRLRRWFGERLPGVQDLLVWDGGSVVVAAECQVCVLEFSDELRGGGTV